MSSPIPKVVITLAAAVEVACIGSIVHVEAILNVLRRMRVDNVQENGQAHAMRDIDELHEVFWGSVS